MRRSVLGLMMTTVLLAGGCLKSKTPATTSGGSSGGSGGGGFGAVQAVRKNVQRTVTMHEMSNLRVFVDSASLASGQMPTKEEIVAAAKQADPKLYQLLTDGEVVLTGARSRESIWAYQKDAPTKGGMVVSGSGVETVTPQEFAQKMALSQ